MLSAAQITAKATTKDNLSPALLIEDAVRFENAVFSADGALTADTGIFTGRSPKDKFIVQEPETQASIWWGATNQPLAEDKAANLFTRLEAFLADKQLYVQDLAACADDKHRFPIRVYTEYAWHSLFASNMFLRPDAETRSSQTPEFSVINVPSFKANPSIDGTKSETFIIVSLAQRMVVIGGTEYAGEIKKSIFSVLNYLLVEKNVLPMHCSANVGLDGDTALFFGLSGTGKTTLSTDKSRALIGDDEHGWSDEGVFNFEGGCYAKTINLSAEDEPEIFATTKRFGSLLENVVLDPVTRQPDFADGSKTENTRVSYPIDFIDNIQPGSQGGLPKNIFFLSADAFGVLPPIARLDADTAAHFFLAGYTAKLAGTERGVTEPQATFSPCFGGPFLPREPHVYGSMLSQKIAETGAKVWLVNTGWAGGAYGQGSRIKLRYTRAMINAALSGALDQAETRLDQRFNLAVPLVVPGVPQELLDPRRTWDDPKAYDATADKLALDLNAAVEKLKPIALAA